MRQLRKEGKYDQLGVFRMVMAGASWPTSRRFGEEATRHPHTVLNLPPAPRAQPPEPADAQELGIPGPPATAVVQAREEGQEGDEGGFSSFEQMLEQAQWGDEQTWPEPPEELLEPLEE
eukprot:2955278-Pyramimonas_sp.AAC.1